MRIVFLGTGDISLPTLRFLIMDSRHDVVGVVTQPDKPVGRKQVITPPEVKVLALENGIPVEQPTRVRKPEALDKIRGWEPEVIVVMAYGQILPKALLDMPSVACLNLHASLLPRHRGAAPIQAAIRDGDDQSGMTVMYVAEGLDTGDVLLQHPFDLAPDETGQSLHDRLADAGPSALAEALDLLGKGEAPRIPQLEAAMTHTGKLTREDGIMDWSQDAAVLDRLVRAFDPWPGTLTHLGDGKQRKRVKIFSPVMVAQSDETEAHSPGSLECKDSRWQVRCGTGALLLSDIQVEGKRRMSVSQFCQGLQDQESLKFS